MGELASDRVRELSDGSDQETKPGPGADEMNALILMQDVVKTFSTPVGDFKALKGITADFHRGEFVGVVGKSGSGKSTLVNMITGIDRPTAGEVRIGGTYVHRLGESDMARWRGANLGIVFQFYQLLPMLSLLENVMMPMDLRGAIPRIEREPRAMRLLEMVGLSELADKRPAAVSGGQQQGAAIARALANDPPIIVADEPTGNLDSRAAEAVFDIFEELAAQGKTIIMVTHDNALAQRTSRTLLLADGEVINDTIAAMLPWLTHRQMLEATHRSRAVCVDQGETIVHRGQTNDYFYMITKGVIDVVLEDPGGFEFVLARLGPGQHFGEIEILRNVSTLATIRASRSGPAELVALDRETFADLTVRVRAMREQMARAMQQRLSQNTDTARQLRREYGQRRRLQRAQAALA